METLDELLQLGYRYCKHEILVFGRIPEQAVVDVFELGKDWRDSYFFGGNFPGHNPGSVWDEDLDGRQLNIRAKVLAAEDSYPEEWAALSDGHRGRTFEVPGTIALCCGYSEQLGEGQSEEEEVEVEVVEEVEEEEVEDEDEDENEREGEDEMAQLIGRLAIST